MDLIKLDGYNNIWAVDSLSGEYKKLFGKDNFSFRQAQSKLSTNLQMLDELGAEAIELQQFERVKNSDGIYSIRHVSQMNTRVLYTLTIDHSGRIILLTCFLEKSTSDYDTATARAESRKKLLFASK